MDGVRDVVVPLPSVLMPSWRSLQPVHPMDVWWADWAHLAVVVAPVWQTPRLRLRHRERQRRHERRGDRRCLRYVG